MGRRSAPPVPGLYEVPQPWEVAQALDSRDRLRGPAYAHPTRGVYLGRPVAGYADAIQVFRAALGKDAVLGGPSAAWALGARLSTLGDPVEVVYPPGNRVRARPGLQVRGDVLLPDEVVQTAFGPATSPARTAFDLSRRHGPGRALAWADALLRATATDAADSLAVAARHPGTRGVRQARLVLSRADGRAESPRESMLRWEILEAELPAPVPQFIVFDGTGCFVARLDLAWPDLKVAVEYDGAHHREFDQHRRDLERHNRLRALGWHVIQIDAGQLTDPERVLDLIRRALARAVTAQRV